MHKLLLKVCKGVKERKRGKDMKKNECEEDRMKEKDVN